MEYRIEMSSFIEHRKRSRRRSGFTTYKAELRAWRWVDGGVDIGGEFCVRLNPETYEESGHTYVDLAATFNHWFELQEGQKNGKILA